LEKVQHIPKLLKFRAADLKKSRTIPMTDQPDPLTFTRFIDWCRTKDRLTAEAKRTVEALLYQLKPYMGKICR
jgi:hypothetical protein